MYVCLCHGLTERAVRGAIDDGCRSVAAVYRQLADRPQCGKCVPDVRGLLRECRNHASHGAASLAPLGAVAKQED